MNNVFELPPSPYVDFRGVLEKGDILETAPLEGGNASAFVTFKDGNQALFSPVVSPMEIAAFGIDSLLGFGIVPAVAVRTVNDQTGLLKYFIKTARPALYYKTWEDMVRPQELLKAAVLDYIMDSRDRRGENFLVDEGLRKLWLINNDYFMFLSSLNRNDVLDTAVKRGLTDLPPDILEAVDRFYSGSQALLNQAKEKEMFDVLNRARERARTVLDKKAISSI